MTAQSKLPRLLSTVELSDYLDVAARTLEAWRARAGGPPFVQFGRQVWYPDDALIDWMNERKVTPTER
ncbi:helix-turn-helix domain-containing protein [Microbacterium sp. PM5]|uniref:helix-turn-helix domain-containing protein n=1 Tax=Microbacterium sp. PM5 TaxID=2014534 RepID=UPI000DD0FCAD|nr:helix-turn-helix domain-containing protein [Microbacterium sp. PM5]AXA95855.1 DNA-binding protein [Microbacterium sp. PM5]